MILCIYLILTTYLMISKALFDEQLAAIYVVGSQRRIRRTNSYCNESAFTILVNTFIWFIAPIL
jgi:hypothetical protein